MVGFPVITAATRHLPATPILLAFPFLSLGCSYLGTARDFDPRELGKDPGWVAVGEVPLILQEAKEDCGAAALAMVLTYWGVPTSAEDVARACPPTPDSGIAAGALRDCARSKGLKAFLFEGTVADLGKELSRRRPVIVGTVKLHAGGGLNHFEVVVGYHRERDIVVTLDPARGWRQNSFEGFLTEWDPTRRLSLVIFEGAGTARREGTGP